jgi:hypothetical protein
MAVITPQEYHDGDDKQHGNYQYVSIEIIDKMILRSVRVMIVI